MTPADKRVMDLLERWLTSIELHLKYADLDETRYRQVQPWPAHERPARWILELAQQKVLQLQTLFKERLGQNDPAFSESLELMCFLANLVGAQHVQRFVPLADRTRENKAVFEPAAASQQSTETVELPKPKAAVAAAPEAKRVAGDTSETERTREMPRLKHPTKKMPPTVAVPAKANEIAQRKVASKPTAQPKASEAPKSTNVRMNEIVVADAVRLLRWGREWHELADLIARMAERPAPSEVRKILRQHKASIEAQLG